MSERTVQIAVRGVGGIWCPREVRHALRVGVWAVTPWFSWSDSREPNCWNVTHVPTGVAAATCMDLKSARQLARLLAERLPDFGARAKFAAVPKNQTSERWRLALKTVRSCS